MGGGKKWFINISGQKQQSAKTFYIAKFKYPSSFIDLFCHLNEPSYQIEFL